MPGFRGLLTILALTAASAGAAYGDWPHWRGPNEDGMARGDAPLRWSDQQHVAWRVAVPGRGHSSPVVWGDRIFVTTAVQAPGLPQLGSTGGLAEHKFMVLCFDRKTCKLLWEKVARVATPHEPAHPANGKLYLASENDDVIVARMGEKFEVLAANTLNDQTFLGTPAILDGEIYLRGQNTLFCIR